VTQTKHIKTLEAFIAEHGIIDLSCDYNGSGDEGYIEDLSFTSNTDVSRDTVMDGLYDLLTDICDWVNNEGGGGYLRIVDGKIVDWGQYYHVQKSVEVVNVQNGVEKELTT